MKHFEALLSLLNDQQILSLRGHMDDSCGMELPLTLADIKTVIDFQGIDLINSLGASQWLTWLRKQQAKDVTARRLPPALIYILNAVPEVIPSQWNIESFAVPYSSTSESEVLIFFETRVLRIKDEIVIPSKMKSPTSDQWVALDCEPLVYFRFLRQRNPSLRIIEGT